MDNAAIFLYCNQLEAPQVLGIALKIQFVGKPPGRNQTPLLLLPFSVDIRGRPLERSHYSPKLTRMY